MRVKIMTLVVLSVVAASTAFGQNNQGGVQGGGTPNYIPKFTGKQTIGNSALFQSGPNLITFDNFAAANVTGTVNGPLSVAVTAVNNTPDGSTDTDAFYVSGLIGVSGQTVSPASAAVEGMAFSATGDPVGVFGKTVSRDRGVGVRGQAVGGAGGGIGVLGESNNENGFAVLGVNGASGHPVGICRKSRWGSRNLR